MARGLPDIDKVLFVVDRKGSGLPDHAQEYERFEKGAANSNTSTAVLQRQLEDQNARIIITTIQKLSRFVAKNKKHPIYEAHVVVIFDECHRSQFGDMHAEITRVFSVITCSASPARRSLPTTLAATETRSGVPPSRPLATKLHTYTIVDAINDKNVLPFRIDYINTIQVTHKYQGQEGIGHRHGAGIAGAGAYYAG